MKYLLILWQLGGKITDVLVATLNRFLSSKTGLLIALTGPLVVIPLPQSVKYIENIISSNWVQLWALFVLGIIGSRASNHAAKAHQVSQKNAIDIQKIHKHLGV